MPLKRTERSSRRTPPVGASGANRRRDGSKSKSPEGAGRQTRSSGSHQGANLQVPDAPPRDPSAEPSRPGVATRSKDPRHSAGCEQGPDLQVVYGGLIIQAEHENAGYPADVFTASGHQADRLFVCDRCFKYTCNPAELYQHGRLSGDKERPRGTLVHEFEGGRYQIYEVDGADESEHLFLQSMCLFGKFFIQNKFIWYEFDNYMFYVLVEKREGSQGKEHEFSVAGFFSKEKVSWDQNNLSCIILFPQYRSGGLGGALIDFSYYISQATGRIGGPEKPISDLGQRGYDRYWRKSVAAAILEKTAPRKTDARSSKRAASRTGKDSTKAQPPNSRLRPSDISISITDIRGTQIISLGDLSKTTGVLSDDILTCLGDEGLITRWDGGRPVLSRHRLRQWAS
ncbi:uncharacterized protein DFL_008543 [Arthrobotrys flagrans]|uniref:histone acetyltransferase n=1 Tax=Arthrobotrys flagrans TaxID=97331 RepID=A0A436ZP20_ARTFL|nr:hypothetical protein DFL_008543 [Arthrobotrys flagrans]